MSITKSQFKEYRDHIAYMRTTTIRAGLNWDGRAVWQSMKANQSEDTTEQSWNLIAFYGDRDQFSRELFEELEEEDENGNTNELNHFMLQCARIPIFDNPTPRKIMQIALNIGQLQSEVELIGLQNLSPAFRRFYRSFCDFGMHEFHAYISG